MLIVNQTSDYVNGLIVQDIGYLYILPIVCSIGFTLNIICIVIFRRPEFKEKMHKYFLSISVVDALILLDVCFIAIARCELSCDLWHTYWANVYELYIYLYCGNALGLLSTLINLVFTFDRYLLVSGYSKYFCEIRLNYLLVGLTIGSFLYYIPIILSREIVSTTHVLINNTNTTTSFNQTIYEIQLSEIGKSYIGKSIMSVFAILRSIVAFVILLVLNILLIISLRRHMDRKSKILNRPKKPTPTPSKEQTVLSVSNNNISGLSNKSNAKNSNKETQAKRKATVMVICICALFVFGHFPDTVSFIYFFINDSECFLCKVFSLCSNCSEMLSYSCSFFIYYIFETKFSNIINQVFRCNYKKKNTK